MRLQRKEKEARSQITDNYVVIAILDYKFVSSGREDANVRMLGTGRPFYCELINPHKVTFEKDELAAMQDEINSLPTKDDVQLRDLTSIKQ